MSLTRSNRFRSSCSSSVARARLELVLRQRLGELFEQLALLAGQLLRRLHLHGREQIAASAAVHVGHALAAAAASVVPVCVPSGTLTVSVPSSVGTWISPPSASGREVHRNLAEQVDAVAPEELVLLHVDDDVEMAGRAAAPSPTSPSPCSRSCWPVAMPAGILTVILRSRATRPAPRHALHGLVMIRPAPRHCGQVRATVKKPCWKRTWPWPRHCGQVAGDDPAAAPDPLQVSQFSWRGIWIDVSAPCADFLERDLEVVAQISAALRTAAPAAAAAEQIAEAEHVAEDVGEVAELLEHATDRTRRRRRRRLTPAWPKRS